VLSHFLEMERETIEGISQGGFLAGGLLPGMVALVAAVVLAAILYGTGLLLLAIGETIGAVLDTAVNTRATAEKALEK
jgi:hypothetical protein